MAGCPHLNADGLKVSWRDLVARLFSMLMLKFYVFLLFSALTGLLALEYTGCALEWWGVGYFVPIDIFYRFGFTDNLGTLYVLDALIWWGASALLFAEAVITVKKLFADTQK